MHEPTTLEPELSTADLAAAAERETAVPRPEHDGARATPLFSAQETEALKKRWVELQTGFVDEPRATVQKADAFVAETMKRLAEVFAQERSSLESQWDRGDDVSTEDLRQVTMRYRAFFDRLLAI